MVEFLQFTLSGVVFGMIYAAVALSLVLIWRGTRLLNYAQGGMAMFTTYVAIEVVYHTGSYWAGFVVALASGMVLGAACQLTVIRPTINKPPLNAVIVTIGLLVLLEGLAGILYGGQFRSFPAGFSITGLKVGTTPLGVSRFDVFVVAAVLVTTLVLAAAFKYTSAGLRMRAAAFNATIARLSASGWHGCSPSDGRWRACSVRWRACSSRRRRSCTRTAWTRSSYSASPRR